METSATPPNQITQRESFADLRSHFDAREIVAEHWGQGRRSGQVVKYCARWRSDDDSASFAVYEDGFKDYGGSGEHGDILTFLQRENGWTLIQAADYLRARRAGAAVLPSRNRQAAVTTSPNEPPSAEWQTAARSAIEDAERNLWANTHALDYLHYGRGLTDATIHRYRLGFNPTWRDSSYRDPDTNKRIGLAPGITIPYESDGAIWAVRIRRRVGNLAEALGVKADTTRDGEIVSKYINLAGASGRKPLFNFDALQPDIDVLFVEGEPDAMLAQQELGESVTVVTYGAASNIPEHIPARQRDRLVEAGNITLAMDNDQAGSEGAKRLIAALVEIGKPPTLYPIPIGKDTTEYVIDHNGDLRAWWARRNEPPEPVYDFPGGVAPVSIQQAINHFCLKAKGGALIFALIQRGLDIGTISAPKVTFAQVQETAIRIEYHIPQSTLYRWWSEGDFPFLHPINDTNIGCNFENERELLPISALKAVLERMHKIEMHVKYFRSAETIGEDPATGRTFVLPLVPADLPTQAFIDAGMDEVSARRAAEALQDDPISFDFQTQGRRAAAARKARQRHEEFCRSLDDTAIVPPDCDILIASEGDYKRAQARAWHKARIDGFSKQSDQLWALGLVSTHTLNNYLEGAGVEKDEQIEVVRLDPAQDIGKQVRASIHNFQAMPVTYVSVDADGVKSRDLYDRKKVDQALARGEAVSVEYQRANQHHVVDLPATPFVHEPEPRRKKPATEKKGKKHVKRSIPTPGAYPIWWTLNHLSYRYRLHFGEDAPLALSVAQLVEVLSTDILIQAADSLGAVVRGV